MQLRQVRESVCLAMAGQTAKLFFATLGVITLLVINNNLKTLIHCLQNTELSARPFPRWRPPLPPPAVNATCEARLFGQVSNMALDCCDRPRLQLTADGVVLAQYKDRTAFVSWLSACHARKCHYALTDDSRGCPKRSSFGHHYLCLNQTRHIVYGSFGGFRLSDGDAFQSVVTIVSDCA